jgi:hypothetical protein
MLKQMVGSKLDVTSLLAAKTPGAIPLLPPAPGGHAVQVCQEHLNAGHHPLSVHHARPRPAALPRLRKGSLCRWSRW